MPQCIFCQMVAGDIKPAVVYEDELTLAFRDINPQAPVHVLVIPKAHVANLNELPPDAPGLSTALFETVKRVAALEGIAESGYRTVVNCLGDAGQAVDHLHLHVIGGRRLHWPPG
jgi:histidine triad (HIT) family protein